MMTIDRERDQFLINTPAPSSSSSLVSSSTATTTSITAKKVQSLELQIQAMQDAFQCQEELLSRQIKQHQTTPQYQYMLKRYITTQSTTSSLLPSMMKSKHEELLSSFPYYALLQTWRKKVIQCLMKESILQSSYQTLIANQQVERITNQEALQTKELQNTKYKQSIQVYQLQIQSLTEELTHYKAIQLQNDRKGKEIHKQYVFYYQEYMKCIQYLMQFQSSCQQNTLFFPTTTSTTSYTTIIQQLTRYEQKITFLQSQIQEISCLLQQKEWYYRNSIANQELLKRLQLLRYQKKQQQGSDEEEVQEEEERVCGYLSEIVITAEMEGIVKTIFTTLDSEAVGDVEVRVLLSAFLATTPTVPYITTSDNDSDSNDSDYSEEEEDEGKVYVKYYKDWLQSLSNDSNDSNSSKEYMRWLCNDVSSPLGQVLIQTLGKKRYCILLYNLLSLYYHHHHHHHNTNTTASCTLTWGEFLVQFVPPSLSQDPFYTPQSQSLSQSQSHNNTNKNLTGRACLSKQEYLVLQHQFHYIDSDCIPLDITSLPLRLPTTHTHTTAHATATAIAHSHANAMIENEIEYENKRLKEERSYLLHELQSLSKKQIRQAEEIKYYFENEIKFMKKQIIKLQHQLEEKEETNEMLTKRIQEMKEHYTNQMNGLEKQCHLLTQEYEQYMNNNKLTKEEAIQQYEIQVNTAKQQITQLENKLMIIQNQCDQKEVKINALHRNMNRLQVNFKQELDHMKEEAVAVTAAIVAKERQHQQQQEQQEAEQKERYNKEQLEMKETLQNQQMIIEKQEEEIRQLKETLATMTLKATEEEKAHQQQQRQEEQEKKEGRTAAITVATAAAVTTISPPPPQIQPQPQPQLPTKKEENIEFRLAQAVRRMEDIIGATNSV